MTSQNKKKMKNLNYDNHLSPFINRPSKKNLGLLMGIPSNNLYYKKTNNYVTKRTQTKFNNNYGKQFSLKNKRKSYMSQGYLMKRVDYSAYIKNQNFNDNNHNNNDNHENENHDDIINNNNLNDNNNSNLLLLKDVKDKDAKEGFFKYDSKNSGEINVNRKNVKKKTNLKKHQFENQEIVNPSNLKKVDSNNIKGRHKSVNFGNQNLLFSSNLLTIKKTFCPKNSSEFVNDSSKQILPPIKNPLFVPSKFQAEKNKFEDTMSRKSAINNNNDNFNNTIIYNNQNEETASYLKTIIQSKIKLIMPPENKEDNYNKVIEKKTNFWEFCKFILICFNNKENKLDLIHNFRNKLLSEEHLYKVHINLYLLEKIFQIDETYKFNINELYNNL